MKLVHTHSTGYHAAYDDGAGGSRCLHIYTIEPANEDEWWEFQELSETPEGAQEILSDLGYEDDGYVTAGAVFTRYSLTVTGDFAIVEEKTAYNI